GFARVHPVTDLLRWEGIEIHRTGGQHGVGEVGRRMAPVSGFVLRSPGERTLYIAGDTIWCREVEEALRLHAPAVTVVNAGAAQHRRTTPVAASPITPPTRNAPGAPQICASVPLASEPTGVSPPITSAYIAITRPRNRSGVLIWRVVLTVAVKTTMLAPAIPSSAAAVGNSRVMPRTTAAAPSPAAP